MNTYASRLSPLFRSDTQADVLARVLLNPDTKHTITQLAQLTGASYATTHRETRRLIDMGLFTEETIGRATLIGANTNHPAYAPSVELITQSHGPAVVIPQLLSRIPDIDSAYIYGSWAARRAGTVGPPPADIDVLVIGNPPRAAINDAAHSAEQRLGRDVNIRVVSPGTWETGDGPFTRTVRNNPLHKLDLDPGHTQERHAIIDNGRKLPMALTLDLNPDEARQLAEIAARDGRTVDDVAREAVEQYIDEDADDQQWAAQVAADWEASDKHTRPLSELRAELGL